ncbi:type II toxin-antitoxin system Phd/YefM family antitoxin [Bosea sp. (in: a-proteobacteria)]|jgi:prevent-host-death family protein|uniref:type II toxin-antitoxin system Phd/YefM family antitoxin n=1 Tax=Bosea sp. (in: a-proteobacteria) TaxID=1871050 RepID=UPI00356466D2
MRTTLSSREFNQDTGKAKRAAHDGPVFITDRGRPSHVLLSIEDYRKLSSKGMTLAEAIADPRPEADFEFDPPRLRAFSFKPADFE